MSLPSDIASYAVPAAAVLAVSAVSIPWLFSALLTPLLRATARLLYRFHVYGTDRVPADGPVLIAANHASYVDWLLLWAACPRPLTFVMWSRHARHPLLRPFLSFARGRLIVLDERTTRPHALSLALDQAADVLRKGQILVVFPEGALTRNGQMRPFGRGIERVLSRAGVQTAVIPTYLDNVWGSLLSYSGGRLFGRRPVWRRRVAVCFGVPLPANASVAEVRAAVVECGAECAIRESDHLLPVHRRFVRTATRWSNLRRTAVVDVSTGTERLLTWPKMLVAAWCLSRWLRTRVGDEQYVGIWLPTGMGSALANLALSFLGKTSVNLNYTAGTEPVRAAIRTGGVRHIITAKRFLTRAPLDEECPGERLYLEEALGSISGREKFLTLLMVLFLPAWLIDRILGLTRTKPDDVLTVIFSSGSTGDPKGVMLSYRNVTANVEGFVRGANLLREDRFLATLPFFHSFGYTVCLWAPFRVELLAVYFPDPRQAKEVGELCRKHACTLMLGTATFLRFYLRRSGPDDFKSLRLLICGAEKLPVPVATEFREKLGVLPLEGYGCTETSPVVGTNLPDAEVAGLTQVANRFGTIGQPIPGVAAKAFDPDTLAPLPPGEDGVLGIKGPNVMLGYLHQPEKTRQVIRDGWYITGDVGRIELDGFIRITGRLSRFAKIGGEMVPIERVEEELHELLEAGGDRLLAVAAVSCSRRGERLVVLHLSQIAGRLGVAFDRLRGRGLPNLWVPDVRDCHEVETFPVLGTGKLDLRGLGELAKKLAS